MAHSAGSKRVMSAFGRPPTMTPRKMPTAIRPLLPRTAMFRTRGHGHRAGTVVLTCVRPVTTMVRAKTSASKMQTTASPRTREIRLIARRKSEMAALIWNAKENQVAKETIERRYRASSVTHTIGLLPNICARCRIPKRRMKSASTCTTTATTATEATATATTATGTNEMRKNLCPRSEYG